MKSFGRYISKYLVSFALFIIMLLVFNGVVFIVTFRHSVTNDYGIYSPQSMLELTANHITTDSIADDIANTLKQNHIWALYLNSEGQSYWSFDLPNDVANHYTIQDVALFSKGYIQDYPVFVRTTDDGLLILGYPKDSYTKLTSNYISIDMLKRLPTFIVSILGFDILCFFLAYYFSKRRIIHNTEPIVSGLQTLADGKPVSLSITGELSQIASSVNKASLILTKQNETRANWITGVSHDIRTPLSMIMGYAGRIRTNINASNSIRHQAEIIQNQSVIIKELVQDLNLVSQLEYEMQPIYTEKVRLSKLCRSYVTDLINSGLLDNFNISLEIAPDSESMTIMCDQRLITRAINNIVQNSIKHNPSGCDIRISLSLSDENLVLSITDNGVGITDEKIYELSKKPHYMESTDDRLDLRHGLGLLIVQQVVKVHKGTFTIKSLKPNGCNIILSFPLGNL